MSAVRRLRREHEAIQAEIDEVRLRASVPRDFSHYRTNPSGYARDVLGVTLTPTQEKIGLSLLEPPYRTLVSSGHDVGKTCLGAVLVSWWFDSFDPSIGLTTAPKLDQVKDLLWKEIRDQRGRAVLSGFAGPKALRLERSPRHFAKGVTANSQEGFQGHHEGSVLVVIDEAEGVDRSYFEAAKTMASGAGHGIVCFYNPYSSSSHVAQEESAIDESGKPSWRLITMSSLDHPNIAAELRGDPPPIPQAVRLAKVQQWVEDWCQPLTGDDVKVTDIEWPPSSVLERISEGLVSQTCAAMALEGQGVSAGFRQTLLQDCLARLRDRHRPRWYRPGPRFEAGVLGRRPTQAVDSLWSVAVVDACIAARQLPAVGPVQIGCDVARFGDDDSCFHVRIGGTSVHHEAANGWSTVQIANRLKHLACQWGALCGLDGRHVPIAVDDCGVGGGVVDILAADGWNVYGVNVSTMAPNEDKYDSLRSALWCDLSDEAKRGNLDFSRLSKDVQQQLRRELPSQQYKLDARGRRCCLSKDRTKALLGRSPDNADAVNLAYCAVGLLRERVSGRVEVVQ